MIGSFEITLELHPEIMPTYVLTLRSGDRSTTFEVDPRVVAQLIPQGPQARSRRRRTDAATSPTQQPKKDKRR